MRPLGYAVGVVGLSSAASLAAFFSFGQPFGSINDVGNGLLGLLSAGLAWRLWRDAGQPASAGWPGIASIGAVLTVAGSWLVVSRTTGFLLAGFVSAVGFGLIGLWLIAASRSARCGPLMSGGLGRLGTAAGLVMATGLASAPVVALGIDRADAVQPWMWAGSLSWLAVYALYPIWALLMGRRSGQTVRAVHGAESLSEAFR